MKQPIIIFFCFLLTANSGMALAAGDVLVYTGEGGQFWQTFNYFEAATGKTVHYEETLPNDLSVYDCLILPTNVQGFSPATLDALNLYTNSGGRIIAAAEHNAAGGLYQGSIDAMNSLAANLGSSLSVVGGYLDCGWNVTTNIHPSPFTEGVSTIGMGCTSSVTVAVGPSAHSLVGTPTSDVTFIGAETIGAGFLFLLGDGNTLSDLPGTGYTTEDNGLLAANMCDQVSLGVEVAIDIKFCSDPNAFNCNSKGVLPVTLFGTESFDVLDIDLSTLKLCTEDLSRCTNAPVDSSLYDRGAPSDAGVAQCAIDPDTGMELNWTLNADGYDDLDVAFDAAEVQSMLETFCLADKGAISEPLVISGTTYSGNQVYSVAVPNVGVDQLLKANK